MQKWHVFLSKTDRKKIKMVLRSEKFSMEIKKRAQILQDLDESGERKPATLPEVMRKRSISENVAIFTRRRFDQGGIDAAIFRKKENHPADCPKSDRGG